MGGSGRARWVVLREALWNNADQLRDLLKECRSVGPRPDSLPRRALQPQKRLSRDEEALVVSAYIAGASAKELGRRLGCHRTSITRALVRNGVELRVQETEAPLAKQAVALYESGLSLARVGARLGLSPNTVLNHLRRNGVQTRGRYDRPGN